MVESRWFRRAGPGIAAIGPLVVIASTTLGARPPTTVGPAGLRGSGQDPGRDADRSVVPDRPAARRRRLDRPAADARSSRDSTTLAGSTSTPSRSRADRSAGPSWSARTTVERRRCRSSTWPADVAGRSPRRDDVVRHATLSPDGRSIVEIRVDRRTRDGPRRVAQATGRRSRRHASSRRSSRIALRPDVADRAGVDRQDGRTPDRRVLRRGGMSLPPASATAPVRRSGPSPTRTWAISSASPTGAWSTTARAAGCRVRWSRSTSAAAAAESARGDGRGQP